MGAVVACLAVVLVIGIPQLTNFLVSKGGPGQSDPFRPQNVIEFNGAYYQIADMSDTELLDSYNLPHEITMDMVGKEFGSGLDEKGNKTAETLYQYTPYAKGFIGDQERSQRAVYVVSKDGEYSFALFYCFVHFDTNTYQEASELFLVYGVDSAEDIYVAEIDGHEIFEPTEIESLFEKICNATAMGNDDYHKAIFGNMTSAEQQKLNEALADSIVEIKLTTTDGLVINNLCYFPTINYVSWGLNYYKLYG